MKMLSLVAMCSLMKSTFVLKANHKYKPELHW